MIITAYIKVKNFEAKLPDDFGSMFSVELDSRTFKYCRYNEYPIYMLLEKSIKISGSYPKNWLKRFWFKIMERIKPDEIKIQYFDINHYK